jgi:hypothetical protein
LSWRPTVSLFRLADRNLECADAVDAALDLVAGVKLGDAGSTVLAIFRSRRAAFSGSANGRSEAYFITRSPAGWERLHRRSRA